MTTQYRFVGTAAFKEGVFDLKYFGQTIALTDEQAIEEIAVNGVALIPADVWGKLFSEEEAKKHPTPQHQANMAPEKKADFEKRHFDARMWIHDFRVKNTAPPQPAAASLPANVEAPVPPVPQ